MKSTFHILNGDVLKNRFPKTITGELFVCRECLIDGNVSGNSLNKLYKNRAEFISTSYQGFNIENYFQKSVSEFEKIQNIPEFSEINLWFEEDVFCQVNLWFTLYLLNETKKNYSAHLVLPLQKSKYSFSGMTDFELESAYQNKINISSENSKTISSFWTSFQQKNIKHIESSLLLLDAKFSFLYPTVQALKESIENERPKNNIRKIMTDLDSRDFTVIFNEFSKKELIYGFGDLQVKRLFDEILLEFK